jgi:hypothetical protein
MTEEDVKKLVELQDKIKSLEEASTLISTKKLQIMFPEWEKYYYLPIDKIEGLRTQIKYMLSEAFDEELGRLKDKFNHLTVCDQIQGGPTYIPTELK